MDTKHCSLQNGWGTRGERWVQGYSSQMELNSQLIPVVHKKQQGAKKKKMKPLWFLVISHWNCIQLWLRIYHFSYCLFFLIDDGFDLGIKNFISLFWFFWLLQRKKKLLWSTFRKQFLNRNRTFVYKYILIALTFLFSSDALSVVKSGKGLVGQSGLT